MVLQWFGWNLKGGDRTPGNFRNGCFEWIGFVRNVMFCEHDFVFCDHEIREETVTTYLGIILLSL